MNGLGNIRMSRGQGEGIELGPLIDIIFILLIFFMVSTTFVRSYELDIERPSAVSAQRADVRAIRVSLQGGDRVLVDGQPVQSWMVQSHVRTLLSRDAQRPVLVTADRRLETGVLVDVVDQCRLAGARDVAVDVTPER